MKRRLSLLFTVGIILVVVFLLSTFTNSREIRENYILTQTSDMNAQARQRTIFVRSELYEYEALSWLLHLPLPQRDSYDIYATMEPADVSPKPLLEHINSTIHDFVKDAPNSTTPLCWG